MSDSQNISAPGPKARTASAAPHFDSSLPLTTAAFIAGAILYGLTCAPGLLWQDSAMFQHRVWFADHLGDSGLPLAHPLYIWLAKTFTLLIPFGDFAWRVNLFSAFVGAASLAVMMHLLINLTRSITVGVIGTIALAVSHTFWTHSVIAEVYNLYALGLLLELWFVQRFLVTNRACWLYSAIFVNGLSVSNHLLALLHAPAYVVLIVSALRSRELSPRQLVPAVVAFVIGSLPYTLLIMDDLATGRGALLVLKESLVGPPDRSQRVLATTFSLARQIVRSVQYFVMNFPTPLLALAPIGFWNLWRRAGNRRFGVFATLIFVVDFVFAFRYLVPDQFVFFTPCYVITALAIASGSIALARGERLNRDDRAEVTAYSDVTFKPAIRFMLTAFALMPVAIYVLAPFALDRFKIDIGAKRDIPYRDTLRYFIQPWKNGETSATRFAEAAFAIAQPDGLIYADTTIKNVLVYYRDIVGRYPGVTLTTGHDTIPLPPVIDRTPEAVEPFVLAGKAFVCSDLPDYVPLWMRERFRLIPSGILFRIVPREQP
ncbi:MAG: DUF2723 domain-containing protein [Phycisphaerae bacterium]|nr:DUF2723 domain-containing protein [Phycisphaerae bacterium]